jgi:lipoyl(octanoyl) transferase
MIHVVHLGLVEYPTALRLQQSLVELRKQGRVEDVLLLLEHTPVITLGRNARRANLLKSDDELAAGGVEIFECDRGGDVTFHGPGQLVAYPIFDLRGFTPKLGVVAFVRKLEEVLIRTCGEFGIPTERVPGLTGAWTRPGEDPQAKIAAIGVHISRGVTSHGFALNVNTDLDCFRLIVPCGIADKPVTAMNKELGRTLNIQQVAAVATKHFGEVFGSETVYMESLDALLGGKVGVPMKPPQELRALFEDEIFLA